LHRDGERGQVIGEVVVAAAAAAPENYCLRELNCTLSIPVEERYKRVILKFQLNKQG
jgi:hypothetical protein